MFTLFVSGLMAVTAMMCWAVAAVYNLWPMLFIGAVCAMCSYCVMSFED